MKQEIIIPAPIDLIVNKEPWTFERCCQHVIDSNKQFNASGPGIRAAVRILAAIRKAVDEKTIASLDEADLKLLSEAMEAPQAGWVPSLSRSGPDGKEIPYPTIPGRLFVSYVSAVTKEAL
jgi:hypothetical protein